MIGKYWQAIEWDFRPENAFEYFLVHPGRFGKGRYGNRRGYTLGRFIRTCEVLSRKQGTYLWSEMQTDPETVAAMAALIDSDKPSRPSLFGWTAEIDRLTNIGDQLIALRAMKMKNPGDAKMYPRPHLPVLTFKRTSELSALDSDIAASQARYVERTEAVNNKQLNSE